MRIRISARKSDLARLQAYAVGQALRKAGFADLSFEFSSSLGDQNAEDPLWQMPEKGVFTADLSKALQEGKTDMVVHSWKDLPTEKNPNTLIAATLQRADPRDLLLIKKESLHQIDKSGTLKIMSSSPRRAYHLGEFLKWTLPVKPSRIVFENVRGNILTRIQKLREGDAHGLVIAKAALDRLLGFADVEVPENEAQRFAESAQNIRLALEGLVWMVLPLSQCPNAAAQGALAIEIRRSRVDLRTIADRINCTRTFADATRERETLSSYGGGCHQKIGVSVQSRSYGRCFHLRGLTDQGEVLAKTELEVERKIQPAASAKNIFPTSMEDGRFYERAKRPVDTTFLSKERRFIWVARNEALPENQAIHPSSVLWAAGLKTWRKLAERGYWVAGCADSLGENESLGLEHLVAHPLPKLKLSHTGAPEGEYEVLATYELRDLKEIPDLTEKTHFFWPSASTFDRAVKKYPHIRRGFHGCGPGHTYEGLKARLGPDANIDVFLSYEEWRDAVLIEE